jgi:glycosyltransferase involved in cell wall biosynthesis
LLAASHEVVVVTRPGRELDDLGTKVIHPPATHGGRIAAHAALARTASQFVTDWRPDLVIVQNFVVAPLERQVATAARRVSAGFVQVIHDHRLHSPMAGTRTGLRTSLRAADEVWAHTRFVGGAIEAYSGRPVRIVPLPVPLQLVASPTAPRVAIEAPVRTAVHFGILKRGYKGTNRVLALAREGVSGWRFRLLGPGAPVEAPGVETTPGFVAAATLVEAVASSDTTLLPYRLASQSGAVTLAQALGAVPVASAVGGIPEQIEDGHDGLLVSAEAGQSAWRAALDRLAADPDATAGMANAAARRVWEGHRTFVAAVQELAVSRRRG